VTFCFVLAIIEQIMSGHSHFATIKRQKMSKDAKKGNLFGKLSKMISIAIKSGGSANPDMNFKLRVAIDKAKQENMPKENIDRILKNAENKADSLEEITYEGFGPFGVAFVVETATDNKNRTAQDMKNIFEKNGGALGGPNSVLYNFENKGFILVAKNDDPDSQTLSLIDLGVEDFEIVEDGIEVYLPVDKFKAISDEITKKGFEIKRQEIIFKPKNYMEINDPEKIAKLEKAIEAFEEHDDVQRVFTNF